MSDATQPDQTTRQKADPHPLAPLDSQEGAAELQRFVKELFTLNHDLNNPLAGVVGYTELALSDPDSLPENIVDYLEKVQKSAGMMQEIIARCAEAKYHLQTQVDVTALKPDDQ